MKRKLEDIHLIAVVVPVYNEADNIAPFASEVLDELGKLSLPVPFELVLIDDGSSDGSGQILDELAEQHKGGIRVIHLARNFGHASALTAGLDHTDADVIITMDGDMQDNPGAFRNFLEKWQEGYDVVYAIRTSREEHILLRFIFWLYYRILRWMANIEMPLDAGNFGLMDRCVVDNVCSLPERNRYFPGLRTWVGFRQTGVEVARRARYDRKSRVGLRGLWALAGNAIFSFSYVPILVFRLTGFATMFFFLLTVGYHVSCRVLFGHSYGLPYEVLVLCFFSGINLLGIAILGEYIARIYDEVKGRPRYIIARISSERSGKSDESEADSGGRIDT